jgi:hypothetical protein
MQKYFYDAFFCSFVVLFEGGWKFGRSLMKFSDFKFLNKKSFKFFEDF